MAVNINSPNKYLLSTDFVPGIGLDQENTKVNVTDKVLVLRRLYSMGGWDKGAGKYIQIRLFQSMGSAKKTWENGKLYHGVMW